MKTTIHDGEGSADALVALLRRPQEWCSSAELTSALGMVVKRGTKAVTWHWQDADDWLRPGDSKMDVPPGTTTTHKVRMYSKRAVIMVGIRSQTANAFAFKMWIGDELLLAMASPQAQINRHKEELAAEWNAQIRALLGLGGGDA